MIKIDCIVTYICLPLNQTDNATRPDSVKVPPFDTKYCNSALTVTVNPQDKAWRAPEVRSL